MQSKRILKWSIYRTKDTSYCRPITNFLFTFFSHFPFPLSVYIPIFDFDQKFGARIVIEGAHILESKKYAEGLCLEEGLTYVNGYDDPPIIAGAGTIGMEVSRNISSFLLQCYLSLYRLDPYEFLSTCYRSWKTFLMLMQLSFLSVVLVL